MSVDAIAEEALLLYDLGFHVFPIPHGRKTPYGSWSFLRLTRLDPSGMEELFHSSNIAVMAGHLSSNLFILDCDTMEDFNVVSTKLQELGIGTWIRNSARGGQFWFLCNDGEVKNALYGRIDVIGNNKYTVAAPGLHPSGIRYTWLQRDTLRPTTVSLSQLPFLPLELHHPSGRHVSHAGSSLLSSDLPLTAHRVLREHDTTRYNWDNSRAEYATCLSLISAGWCDNQIMNLFRRDSPPHFVKQGESKFAKYILGPARHRISKTNPVSTCNDRPSSKYRNWANATPWPGRTGNSDKAVYLALCERMRLDNKLIFRASAREISELASVNPETACRALRRLIEMGLVTRQDKSDLSGAFTYSLQLSSELTDGLPADGLPSELADGRLLTSLADSGINRTVGVAYNPVRDIVRITPEPTSTIVRITPVNHDVWHRKGLGKSAHQTYEKLLTNGEMTVGKIVEMTGRSERTVRTALDKLLNFGLAERTANGWKALPVSEDHLDTIAEGLETQGRAAQRKEKHRTDRAKRANNLLKKQIADWHVRSTH